MDQSRRQARQTAGGLRHRQGRGFSLNVSNYVTTEANTAYGNDLSGLLGGKHFVIDTSRNGNGPYTGNDGAPTWCNPPGRAIGDVPSTTTAQPLVAGYWIKAPGESDGACRPGAPPAGVWWPDYALGLVQGSQGEPTRTQGRPRARPRRCREQHVPAGRHQAGASFGTVTVMPPCASSVQRDRALVDVRDMRDRARAHQPGRRDRARRRASGVRAGRRARPSFGPLASRPRVLVQVRRRVDLDALLERARLGVGLVA